MLTTTVLQRSLMHLPASRSSLARTHGSPWGQEWLMLMQKMLNVKTVVNVGGKQANEQVLVACQVIQAIMISFGHPPCLSCQRTGRAGLYFERAVLFVISFFWKRAIRTLRCIPELIQCLCNSFCAERSRLNLVCQGEKIANESQHDFQRRTSAKEDSYLRLFTPMLQEAKHVSVSDEGIRTIALN